MRQFDERLSYSYRDGQSDGTIYTTSPGTHIPRTTGVSEWTHFDVVGYVPMNDRGPGYKREQRGEDNGVVKGTPA